MGDTVDQVARDLARDAMAAIQTHNAVCDERAKRQEEAQQQTTSALVGVQSSLQSLTTKMDDGLRRVHVRIDNEKTRSSDKRHDMAVSSAVDKGKLMLLGALVMVIIGAIVKFGIGG